MKPTIRIQTILALGAAGLALGCSTGSDGGTGPGPGPGPTPTIAIALGTSSLTIAAGQSGQLTASVTRGGNYAGNVSFEVQGVPAGISASTSGTSASGNTVSTTITVTVLASVAPGSHQLTVRASGTGVSDATASATLTILAESGFTLSLAPVSPSIATGGSATVQISIARTNFSGAVTLTLEGGSFAVSGSFSPASTTGSQSTLTLTVHPSAQVAVHNLAVTGTATGAAPQTAPLPVAVLASGGFVLTSTPSGFANLAQGGNVPVAINVERTGGFSGIVAMTVTGAVPGLTATLNSPQTPDNGLILTFVAAPGLALGSYAFTVRGTSGGVPERTVNVTVNVSSASVGSIVFDYSACPAGLKPLWLAIQDGDGAPWQRVVPASDRYAFDIANNRSAVTTVFAGNPSGNTVQVEYLDRAEIQARGAGSPCTTALLAALKSISGTVTNVGAGEQATISLGGSTAVATLASPSFQLPAVADGIQDLVAGTSPQSGAAGSDRGLFVRDLDITHNGSVGTLDFGVNNTFTLLPTVTNLTDLTGGETVTQSMSYLTRNACMAAPLYATRPVTGNSFTAYAVPAGVQRTTDRHALSVIATTGNTSIRTITAYFRNGAGTRTLQIPGELNLTSFTVESGSYKRLRVEGTTSGLLNAGNSLSYTAQGKTVLLTRTAAYLGSAISTIAIETPNFSSIPGWSDSWAPTSAAQVSWTVSATGIGQLGGFCTDFGNIVSSARTGVI